MKTKNLGKEVILFNEFQIPFLPRFNYWMDGDPGKRTLFIVDAKEKVQIIFEEGMECLDEHPADWDTICVHSEYEECGKCLYQCRISPIRKRRNHIIFFHMEIKDALGNIRKCPGQMIHSFTEKEKTDSILISLLNGLELC